MTERDFGQQLLFFRRQSIDQKTGKPLTQQEFGEQVGHELGRAAYTGAAVSDWERGKSRISAEERLLLLSLVKILKRHGGIKTPEEANLLLEAGNFRSLNQKEKAESFPDYNENSEFTDPPQNPSNLHFLLDNLNLISPAEYRVMLEKAKQGPDPFWPRMAVSLIRHFTDGLTPESILRGILWLWIIYLSSELFIGPSLKLNLGSREEAFRTIVGYSAGSIIVPLLIGGMTNTKNNPYWIRQNMHDSPMLRLYAHQGAFVGYHVGYYFVLLISFLQDLLGIGFSDWLELIKTIFPLATSIAGAQLVPYNLWLAYSRLWLKDGGIFFVFIVLGPLWALFFIRSYELFSSQVPGVYLVALTIMVIWEALKKRTKSPTTKQ